MNFHLIPLCQQNIFQKLEISIQIWSLRTTRFVFPRVDEEQNTESIHLQTTDLNLSGIIFVCYKKYTIDEESNDLSTEDKDLYTEEMV